jgi:hypothetical protein
MAVPIRPDDDAHAEAEELLPWYSTGQLDDKDRALVEKHLATCVACQRQLRFDQKMVDEFQSLDPQVDSGWHRLRGRIEQDVRRPSRMPPAFSGAWSILRRPAVATLAAAQLAFVVVAGGVLLSLSRPDYQTLGSSTQPAPGNVIVIFRADATQKDILEALRASGAAMVGGPTPADAYLLRVPPQRRAAALASLQADDDVQMAQPIDEARQ